MSERLQNERWTVEIDPRAGGRVSRLVADGIDLIVRRDEVVGGPTATNWGSYPMVPWAGRIRRGRFTFAGRSVQLPINFGRHAIHGVGLISEWAVVGRNDSAVDLELALPNDMRWPFGGIARQRFELDATGLLMSMSVTAGDHAFPASLGWHPWFNKPDSLDFRPNQMYVRDDDHVTIDQLVTPAAPPWDDCFLNDQPVTISIGGTTIRLSSDCDHWVVYDMPELATCIEPQTGPPDAPNIRPRTVEPGTELSAWYRLVILDH